MHAHDAQEEALVLVVSPDEGRRDALRASLDARGIAVVESVGDDHAFACYKRRRPHLVLLEAANLSLCQRLRESGNAARVPVIALVPGNDPDSIEQAYSAGATDVFDLAEPAVFTAQRICHLMKANHRFETISNSLDSLAAAQRIARVGSWEWNTETGEMQWSDEMFRILGIDPDGSKTDFDRLCGLVHPDDQDGFQQQIREGLIAEGSFCVEHRLLLAADEIRHVNQRGEVLRQDRRPGLHATGVIQDVTDQRQTQDKMQYLANYDALTGLANRRLFKERLALAIAGAEAKGHSMALLFMDLDRFKRINDTLGHSAGDELLRTVADRLRMHVRGSDLVGRQKAGNHDTDPAVSRLGGDEFTVLLSKVGDPSEAGEVAARILEKLPEPIIVEGHTISPSGSIGIAVYPMDGEDDETLLKNADIAMYHAKQQRQNSYHFFSSAMNATLLRKLTLESRLREALPRDELHIHYQPRVEFATDKVIGMEALLRWNHPELGVVSPREFIPVTEEAGLITQIGRWVLMAACTQAKQWQNEGYERILLSVNVSARQFAHNDVTDAVAAALQSSGLDPHDLELEITESVMIRDDDATLVTLRDLRSMGVRISLDDFGTGYSSLSYITRFPLDTLKMDKNFIRDVATDPCAQGVVSAVINMAHSLNLSVVAEGVDEAEQAKVLRLQKCDEMQGFLFSGALPPDEFVRFLRRPGTVSVGIL